ncbi:MAG: crossover junction endodeoxyribonuclease RuvC [Treponemataceae bacterium]
MRLPASSGPVRRIIGVDPGLAAAGWGIIEAAGSRITHIAHGCIQTKANTPRSERLLLIYKAFKLVLEEYLPTESGMETLYFAKNITSAMPVAEARGVLCLALAEKGLFVHEYTPMAIKQAVVGRGAAEKAQVQELVRLILGLQSIPKPDHAADALGAAVCRAHDASAAFLVSD